MWQGLKIIIQTLNGYYYIWRITMGERRQEVVNIYHIILQTNVFKALIRVITKNQRATLVLWKGAMEDSTGHREERRRDGEEDGIKKVLDQHLSLSKCKSKGRKWRETWCENGRVEKLTWMKRQVGGWAAEMENKIRRMEPQRGRDTQQS